jgi:hypothetical protein
MRPVAWALCRRGHSGSETERALPVQCPFYDNDAMVESEIAEFNNAKSF